MAQHAGVLLHLVHQFQFGATLFGHGRTEYASAVLEHEVDFLRRDRLRRRDEVAFVLAVLVIHDYHELAGAKVV